MEDDNIKDPNQVTDSLQNSMQASEPTAAGSALVMEDTVRPPMMARDVHMSDHSGSHPDLIDSQPRSHLKENLVTLNRGSHGSARNSDLDR